ncbi:MAG: SpaA isopeptide-forming pilin-related protein, partial [Micrococcales bacterium]|nr:SpaA isopeptide-forming pilin-related protein [Micrococcales bacterium]
CTAANGCPTTWTGIKIVVNWSMIGAPGITTDSDVMVGYQVNADATAGSELWALGSNTYGAGVWWPAPNPTSSSSTLPGTFYGATTTQGADFARVIGWSPVVSKSASISQAKPGQVVDYTVDASASLEIGGSENVSFSVVDALPAGESYVTGSASVAPASVVANADGTTTLTWNLDTQYNTDNAIAYSARILALSGTVTNTASVTAPDPDAPAGSAGGFTVSATASVAVVNPSTTVLLKQAADPQIPAGLGADTWELTLTNMDLNAQSVTDVIDVLPYNGDGRGATGAGTSYHGSFAVTGVTAPAGQTIYYTTADPATLSGDPADASNGAVGTPSAIWSVWPASGPAPAGVTGLRFVGGTLAAGASVSFAIDWSITGEQVGDVYQNLSWARADGTELVMMSGDAATVVTDASQLQIHKEFVSADGWQVGDLLHWKLTVYNGGTDPAYEVVVTDIPGANLTATGASYANPSQGTVAAGSLIWQVGTLAAGAYATVDVSTPVAADVDLATQFVNYTTVSSPAHPYDDSRPLQDIVANSTVQADTDQADYATASSPLDTVFVQKKGAATTGGNVDMCGSTWQVLADATGKPGASILGGGLGVRVDSVGGPTAAAAAPGPSGVVMRPVGGVAGLWQISGLMPGAYWLQETSAPQGFNLLPAPVGFTVNPDGSVVMGANAGTGTGALVTAAAGTDTQVVPWWVMTVQDIPAVVLPSTGGTGDWPWLAGGALMLVGTVLIGIGYGLSQQADHPRRKVITIRA